MKPPPEKPLHTVHHYRVENYKGYLIYGTSHQFGDNENSWVAEGIILSNEFPERIDKLHHVRSHPSAHKFVRRDSAEDYALGLCRIWGGSSQGEATSSR